MNMLESSALRSVDPKAAFELACLMSSISEDYYCAGWLIGLEYVLWDMVGGADRGFGLGEVTEREVAELRRLHEACGGWWAWDGDGADSGEKFLTAEEWEMHLKTASKRPWYWYATLDDVGDTDV